MSGSKNHVIFFAVFAALNAANTNAGVQIIVNAPPPAREIIASPPGSSTCYMVTGGFYNGVWQHTHRVCEYQGGPDLRMWVNGYWQCKSYLPGGICTHWGWVGSHWASRRDINFYRSPIHTHREYRSYRQTHVQEHGYRKSKEHSNLHGHPF